MDICTLNLYLPAFVLLTWDDFFKLLGDTYNTTIFKFACMIFHSDLRNDIIEVIAQETITWEVYHRVIAQEL